MSNQLSLDQKRNEAWEKYELLRKAIINQSILFIGIGKTLKYIRDEKLYNYLGDGGYSTFQHFLANPEVGVRPSTAYLYIRIYEYYCLQLTIPEEDIVEIPINRLMKLLPALKEKEDKEAKEIILGIGQLTSYDYDEEVKEKKLETPRPKLIRNKETGLWSIEFMPDYVERVTNQVTGENIYEQ